MDEDTGPRDRTGVPADRGEDAAPGLGKRRGRFLLRLSDTLRRLRDADAIVTAACRALGEHLDAARVAYVDIDETTGIATPLPAWTAAGTDALPGRIAIAEYSPVLAPLRAGATVRIDDHHAEPWLASARPGLDALGVRAIVSVPLRKDGALTGNLNVHRRAPHAWTDAEVALVEAVAERIWEAVERARAETDLRAREEELRLVTDALPGLVSHIGPDERYIYVNKLYEQWFGRSRDTVIGRTVREVVGEDGYARIKTHLDRALAGERVRFEDRIAYPDSAVRDLVAEYIPAQDADGRTSGIFALVQDVSDVRQSEQRLRGVLNGMAEGFTLLAPDFTIVEMNHEGLRLDGRRRREIVGRTHWEAYPGSEDLEIGHLYKRAMRDRVPVALEHRYEWQDGHARWLDMRAYPTPDGGLALFWRDVTDRKEAETRLRDSEARFRGVFDSALMGFTIFDAATSETLAINDHFLVMTGHSRADFEAGRWDWRDFTVAEHLALDEAAIAQARARGWWDPYEKEYRRRDGTRFPVRLSSAPLPGEPGRVIVSVQDMTDAHRAEAELRESEQRLQLAKEAAGIGVWDWDLVTNHITWSKEVYAILGVDPATPADQLFEAWTQAVHPADRDWAVQTCLDGADRGAGFSMDFRVVDADGAVRWVRSQATALLDGQRRPARLTGINLDVTAQHLLEDELRARADSLAAEVQARTRERNRMFELSSDLFAVAGFDGYLKSINPAWTRLLGYSEEELLAAPFITLIHPDDHAGAAAVIAQLREGSSVRFFEDRLFTKGGDTVAIAWAAVPEGDRFYAVGRDVTREREREEALRQAQKMEAVGQLTGGIAHDFNNLLGAVLGGFDLIRRRPDDPDRVRRIAENGIAAAERGAKLTGQLLAFSRAQRIETRAVVVADVVDGMRELLAGTLGPQVRLRLALEDGGRAVLSDPVQLEMAVLNLAINARDVMPEGGELGIRTARRRIDGDAELASGHYVELSVSDTGSGMPPEVAARAFDPFFTTKGVGKGTGLGLSQVYGIARQAGGAARIRSQPGQGTTVSLLLPVTDAPRIAGGPAPDQAASGPDGTATVLVIDDDDDLRRMLAESLDSLGYRALAAADGSEGLDLLARQIPDLVVVDFAMPGMNGAEVAAAIRASHPDLPILFASGYADTAAIERAVGPDARMLRKPFGLNELQAAVRAALAAA